MRILRSPSGVARVCRSLPKPLVLVPTMGALHAGHAALIQRARILADASGAPGSVAVSVFVNPAQFGPKEDFSRYPRTLRADAETCLAAGADLLFAPSARAMYAPGCSAWVDESALSKTLCGASRPGHFRGVCTVVSKLFHIISPEIAVFGKKDAQQLAIIRRMVRDLNFQIEIAGVETFREPDGLAMSSRNLFLSPEARAQAPALYQALAAAQQTGPAICVPDRLQALVQTIRRAIETATEGRIDYVEAVDAETLAAPDSATCRLLVALAVFFGPTRLIDNVEIDLRAL